MAALVLTLQQSLVSNSGKSPCFSLLSIEVSVCAPRLCGFVCFVVTSSLCVYRPAFLCPLPMLCVCKGQKKTLGVLSCSINFYLVPLRQGLSVNPDPGLPAPVILCPTPSTGATGTHGDSACLVHVCWDPHSGAHAAVSPTSPAPASQWPHVSALLTTQQSHSP